MFCNDCAADDQYQWAKINNAFMEDTPSINKAGRWQLLKATDHGLTHNLPCLNFPLAGVFHPIASFANTFFSQYIFERQIKAGWEIL